jgi:hypothetical protein
MALMVLLTANGAWLTRVEASLKRSATAGRLAWRQLSVVSACSISLWLATMLAGVVLTNKA